MAPIVAKREVLFSCFAATLSISRPYVNIGNDNYVFFSDH